MKKVKFKELSEWHIAILNRLMSLDFEAKDQVLGQLQNAEYVDQGYNRGLNICCDKFEYANVINPVPVEFEAVDSDDSMIHDLLHVSRGRVIELEIFKENATEVLVYPKPEECEMIVGGNMRDSPFLNSIK